MRKRRETALIFILKGLVPYTNANFLLTFKPNAFFNELERISGYNRKTLRNTYYRAKRQKLISTDNTVPQLTLLGKERLQPFVASYLDKNAKLMVIFDIPELHRAARNRFRQLLKNLYFVQAQQSVWVTEYDHRDIVKQAIEELELNGFVQVYEAALLK